MVEFIWLGKTIQISPYKESVRPATSSVVFQQDHWKYFHLYFLIILHFLIPPELGWPKTPQHPNVFVVQRHSPVMLLCFLKMLFKNDP